jgi:hypothetical protein
MLWAFSEGRAKLRRVLLPLEECRGGWEISRYERYRLEVMKVRKRREKEQEKEKQTHSSQVHRPPPTPPRSYSPQSHLRRPNLPSPKAGSRELRRLLDCFVRNLERRHS